MSLRLSILDQSPIAAGQTAAVAATIACARRRRSYTGQLIMCQSGGSAESSTSYDWDAHANPLICVVGLSLPSESFRIAFVTMFAVIEGLALQRASGNATVEIAKAAKAIVFDAVSTILNGHLAEMDSADG